ncbi:hypothetical protein GCM10023085_04280 [Actinomadura viridis]|uniref:Erythromycin esterase n=1 Tax=Actinomadura viridis TaxID=58110 RepID=A0A931DP77_9ACTN|nr:erythromycin esterase family protein [Actinomadura viridis]MBG6091246.1 erythromycin esterase [Actinomadura viridis]
MPPFLVRNRGWPAAVATLSAAGSLAAAPVARAEAPRGDVVEALNRGARPLRSTAPYGGTRDLRALGRMIGPAGVVGLGEATHNSHEFFALKHRVFRYLAEKKGFTTFMQEVGWGSGLRINDYVLHGKGDLRKIMREEFQGDYVLWNNEEYRRLLTWMREYNRTHRKKLQYMGDDVVYPHVRIFQEIFRYVRKRHRPDLVPRLRRLYDGLIPTTPDTKAWDRAFQKKTPAERRRVLRQSVQALELLRTLREGADPRAARWAEQQARVAIWIARVSAPAAATPALNRRDQGMAANTAWWYRNMKSKILLSAHNAHIGYAGLDPQHKIKRQGAWLRDMLGRRYVNIGLTFYRGSFNALDLRDRRRPIRRFTVGPPARGTSERVLDRVRHRDYMLDMRTVGRPARSWLEGYRRTRNIGNVYPQPYDVLALRRTYEILIHLHRVRAARLLDRTVPAAPPIRPPTRARLPATL